MSENEHNDPAARSGAPDSAPQEPHRADQGEDHELFAPESLNAESELAPGLHSVGEPQGESAGPAPRRGGFVRKLLVSLASIVALLAGVGGAAVVFKDKDERLRAISDMIDEAAKDPMAFAEGSEAKISAWVRELLGEEDAKPAKVAASRNETQFAAEKPRVAEKASPAPSAAAPGWASPQESKPAPSVKPETAPAAAPPPEPAARHEDRSESQALLKRVEQLEATARGAAEAAREAQQRVEKLAEPDGEKHASSEVDAAGYAAALEGRIDELADEIRQLRERLDQPKSENRVAPEAAEAVAPAPPKGASGAEVLSLAHSLQQALERGRPFAAQLSALGERGVEPRLLSPLSSYAEHGAPTSAQLLDEFKALATRLTAMESAPASGASLADQLLHDAGKLVRVRPVGESNDAANVNEAIGKVESALARGEFDVASEALAKLPEKARTEAQSFADALNRRREAEDALTSLVAAAVEGLGHVKN